MIRDLILRYAGLVLSCAVFFAGFTACGADQYGVPVDEDPEQEKKVVRANPNVRKAGSSGFGIHATRGWIATPIPYRVGAGLDAEQSTALHTAILQWEWACGKQLFSFEGIHQGTSGDSFSDLYSSLADKITGNYNNADWKKTGKPMYVLATTVWKNDQESGAITRADVRYNTETYIIGDSLTLHDTDEKDVVDMHSLALHELGHLLGLAHVSASADRYSIMNPTLYVGEGLTSRELSRGDITRLQKIYGCSGKACDVDGLLAEGFPAPPPNEKENR